MSQRPTLYRLLPLFGLVLAGCSSEKADQQMVDLEKQIEAKLDANQRELASKIDNLAQQLSARRQPEKIDPSTLKRGTTSDLAWMLITADPKEKAALVRRRVEHTAQHRSVDLENVQAIVTDLEGLNVILHTLEDLNLALVQEVEAARNRLVDLLRQRIPGLVQSLDARAVKTTNYAEAKRLWAQSSALLGFYPSSNDPIEAGKIQELVTSHDLVRTRSELQLQQRYNLWTCQQIRKAWKDFEEEGAPAARMNTCLFFLGPIHPGLLDPVSLELYRDFLQTVRSKLSKELYQDLAEKLAVTPRKTLADLGGPP